jgi:PAS domain-containing protein
VYGADITDKKIAEEKLQENEKRYRILFDKMDYGYALQDIVVGKNKNLDYRFIDVNEAFERLSKLKKADVLGKIASQVTPKAKTKEYIDNKKNTTA